MIWRVENTRKNNTEHGSWKPLMSLGCFILTLYTLPRLGAKYKKTHCSFYQHVNSCHYWYNDFSPWLLVSIGKRSHSCPLHTDESQLWLVHLWMTRRMIDSWEILKWRHPNISPSCATHNASALPKYPSKFTCYLNYSWSNHPPLFQIQEVQVFLLYMPPFFIHVCIYNHIS